MSKTVVHMIGQAHLDPVWLWRWTEGRAEALATSRSAADRLSEYPDFHFVRGEAQVYEWIEQEDPRLFAQILTFIEQGRWHVVNGMIIQPDMNLPQGESIVRQILLGKAYMRERLGRGADRGLLRGQLRPCRHPAPGVQEVRFRGLCLYAARPARKDAAGTALLVARP